VRQKEALKALRAEVDVLTLTATPIPRTLGHVARRPARLLGDRHRAAEAAGDQDLRQPASPTASSAKRCCANSSAAARCTSCTTRSTPSRTCATSSTKLLPEARIVVGHGQMNERELERVMRDFTQQRANLLLCTTIIETGIDNPHANTIVINRADKFGLAQLHQLRGRVGRSHHQAYAYLLTHDDATPSRL
jgi:transcription-repair coupling factor (superfamily II helicase)